MASSDDLWITLKNYRCFEDERPATVQIGPGFTALVGPNNCGKSVLLKWFFEMRNWFAMVSQPTGVTGNLLSLLNGGSDGAGFHGVYDHADVYCDRNDRDMSVAFKVFVAGSTTELAATSPRSTPTQWQIAMPSMVMSRPATGDFGVDGMRRLTFAGQPVPGADKFNDFFWAFRNGVYYGPFRNALNVGAGEDFDLSIGTKFIETWRLWKTGLNKQWNRETERVTRDIARIFGIDRLEINAADGAQTLHVVVDGRPYKLRELGAGLAQFILVFANAAIRRPAYIFIDEPELNLHPSLQIDFLTSLASYATHGIVFATHSIGLARATAERIYSFQRDANGRVVVAPLGGTTNFAEFAGAMSFSSYQALGFDKLLLVEGVTDVRTVQQFLRLLKKEHKIVVLPLGGTSMVRGGVEQELSELKRITPNVFALVDSERTTAGGAPHKDREAFQESCKKLGFKVHLTERRATENYFTEAAVRSAKGPTFKALGPFDLLKDAAKSWTKADNWAIARHMSWDDLGHTDVGHFLLNL